MQGATCSDWLVSCHGQVACSGISTRRIPRTSCCLTDGFTHGRCLLRTCSHFPPEVRPAWKRPACKCHMCSARSNASGSWSSCFLLCRTLTLSLSFLQAVP